MSLFVEKHICWSCVDVIVFQVSVPSSLGFGDREVETKSGVKIPPGSLLKYTVSLKKVSVAPS